MPVINLEKCFSKSCVESLTPVDRESKAEIYRQAILILGKIIASLKLSELSGSTDADVPLGLMMTQTLFERRTHEA